MNLDETMKENYTERYKRIAQTEQFKKSYCDKSLGKEAPASEDLEEACDNYYDETWDEHGGVAMVVNNCHDVWFPSQAMSDFFKAGAEWQKQKDLEDLFKSDMTMPNKFYEKGKADAMKEMKETLQTEYKKGRFDMREEMMKDAVEGDIFREIKSPSNIEFQLRSKRFKMEGIKLGDKVKIIIVKED